MKLSKCRALLAAVILSMIGRPVGAAELLPDLQLHSPVKACNKDCLLGVYVGQLVNTPMHDIFISKHIMPWDWQYFDSTLISGTIDRPVVTYGRHIEIDAELGAGKRFGILHEEEIWGALYFRIKRFPWDDYIRTSVAISTGINVATDVAPYEQTRTKGAGDQVLHYLSPELTLGLPQYPDWDFVARFHHRSGGNLTIFNHTTGGAQYGEIGLRYRL